MTSHINIKNSLHCSSIQFKFISLSERTCVFYPAIPTMSSGYGAPAAMRGPFFDGDEENYEMWEDRLLSYMRIQKLKDAIDPDSNTIVSRDAAEEAYAQLVHFLDKRSHILVMRDAKNNGRKALKILREHYRGSGKQRIISLYTTLTTLKKEKDEDLTSYIIRAENAATSLKTAGSIVEDCDDTERSTSSVQTVHSVQILTGNSL